MIDWAADWVTFERKLSAEKGPFALFVLVLRETMGAMLSTSDVLGRDERWDLVVAASWLKSGSRADLDLVVARIRHEMGNDWLVALSRVVVLSVSDPFVQNMNRAIRVEHGSARLTNVNLFGVQIQDAIVITSGAHLPLKLSLHETMWAGDGPELRRDNPIQYEVRGLPPDQEQIFIGQNLRVRPIRWRVLRTRNGVRSWGDDYETPQAALAALQREYSGKT